MASLGLLGFAEILFLSVFLSATFQSGAFCGLLARYAPIEISEAVNFKDINYASTKRIFARLYILDRAGAKKDLRMRDKDAIRTMIAMSGGWEDADKIITEFTPWKDAKAKLPFLSGMFQGSAPDAVLEDDYRAILSAIVSMKWR